MNIIKCFKHAEKLKQNDFFTFLYYSKMYALMNEDYYGKNFTNTTNKDIEYIKNSLKNCDSIEKLTLLVCKLSDEFKRNIPYNIFNEYGTSNYDTYTDKYYHRMYWNEIPNFDYIEIFLKKFIKLYNAQCISEEDKMDVNGIYGIRLYNYNDFEIGFKSLDALEKFASLYDLTPYSVHKI